MAYTRTTWVDEVLTGAERFDIKDNVGADIHLNVQILLATGVSVTGTSIDAAHLNNIETGIVALATGAAVSVKGVAGGSAGDTADIVASSDGRVLRRSGGVLAFAQITAAEIATDAVSNLKILNGAVTEAKIGSLAVTEGKIGTEAVTNTKLGALSVDSSKLAALAVIAGKIANGAVDTTARLANNIVDDTKAGNRVAQFLRRQGGTTYPTSYADPGSTNYTPTAVRVQWGAVKNSTAGLTGVINVTYPLAFYDDAIVLVSCTTDDDGTACVANVFPDDASMQIVWHATGYSPVNSIIFYWMAIGPETA